MTAAPVLVRVALVVVALLASAWLAAGLRAIELESEAQTVLDRVSERPPQADIERAIDNLRDARRYNADKTPDVNRALLLWQGGRLEQATALGERVVADEPLSVEGWFALWAISLQAGDRQRAARVIAQLRELDPLRARTLERFDRASER